MRRLYIAPLCAFKAHKDSFHPRTGAHYLTLHKDDRHQYVLVSADFQWEGPEEAWHQNPDVAILPDPTFEGKEPIHKFCGCPVKKIQQHHLDGLAALGVVEGDTVIDVSNKAKKVHPLVKTKHLI